MSKPWWEQEWTTRQTHQGTWVRVDNGHEYGPDSRTMAMVYAPETRDMEGETLKERSDNADAQALDCAKGMAASPDMARALLAIRERVAQAGDALPRPRNADEMAAMEDSFVTIPTEMLRAAFDALRKAGAL